MKGEENLLADFVVSLACVVGVRKGRGRELGCKTAREGGGERLQAIYHYSEVLAKYERLV